MAVHRIGLRLQVHGVPQGSVLEPLLFILDVIDITDTNVLLLTPYNVQYK